MQINPRNGRFYAVFRGFLHPAGVCRARRAAAVVGRSWASWARKRTPTAADAHNLKIVVKLRAVPASKVPFPVGIAGFPDFSRPVPVYPAFLKYVVPVQRHIVCNVEGFPYKLIWSALAKPVRFVCIEPWHSLPSAENDPQEWNERAAAVCLAPGKRWSTTLSTTVER